MKRILLIIPYGGVGGMERLALSFYNHFKKEGHFVKAVKFIKLDNDIISFGNDELFYANKDFSKMSKAERLTLYLKMPFFLRKQLRKYKITHSIAFGAMPNVYSSLTFTKEYKIASIHALKSIELSNNSLLSRMTRFGYKYTFSKLDKVVCISKAIKEDLINNCKFKYHKKLKVIYNPHDVQYVQSQAEKAIDTKEELSLFDENTILFIGRLSAQKSPWHLIKSMSLLLQIKPEAKLLFIGDGDPTVTKDVNRLIDKFGIRKNIHFLGRKSNPFKYLKKAKVLALASHYEGTPNVIVEAIAVGTPIVSSCCTDGIIELMSLQDHKVVNEIVQVESGIITPNLFKSKLGIPKNDDFLEEEHTFANALELALNSTVYRDNLLKNQSELLSKFELNKVALSYLSE